MKIPKSATDFFEAKSSPKILREEKLIRQEARTRGIPVRELSIKQIEDRTVLIRPDEFPVGRLPFMEAAFWAMSRNPSLPGYPEALGPWLHRKIKESTLGQLQTAFQKGTRRKPVFIKPTELSKLFRGRIVYSDIDIARLPYPEDTKIWCSDVVKWKVEWRCYVINGAVRNAQCYLSNGSLQNGEEPSGIRLDLEEVSKIVHSLIGSQHHPVRTFILDVGQLANGKLGVVEWDYAYSVGAYGLAACDYFDFLWSGWQELVS